MGKVLNIPTGQIYDILAQREHSGTWGSENRYRFDFRTVTKDDFLLNLYFGPRISKTRIPFYGICFTYPCPELCESRVNYLCMLYINSNISAC